MKLHGLGSTRFAVATIVLLTVAPTMAQHGNDLEIWIDDYAKRLPRDVDQCTNVRNAPLAEAADAIEKWTAVLASFRGAREGQALLAQVDRLIAARQRVDRLRDETLALRVRFAEQPPSAARRSALRNYLRTVNGLIDLCGRMRYQLTDAFDYAAYLVARDPTQREKLIDLFCERDSAIGASVMAVLLSDPPADSPKGVTALGDASKKKLLRLIGRTGETSLLSELASFLRDESTPPELTVLAAETIRRVGLPQDERPETDKSLPKPEIVAAQVHEILAEIPSSQLSGEAARLREELLAWYGDRMKLGLSGDRYRLGRFEVQPGDWLLMRNPSRQGCSRMSLLSRWRPAPMAGDAWCWWTCRSEVRTSPPRMSKSTCAGPGITCSCGIPTRLSPKRWPESR